jgi:hypothetical protein
LNKPGQYNNRYGNANSESYVSGKSLEGKNFITFGAKKTPTALDKLRQKNYCKQQMSTPQLFVDKNKKAVKLARNKMNYGSTGTRLRKLKSPKQPKGNKEIITKYTHKLNVQFESGSSGKFKNKGTLYQMITKLDLKAIQKNINNSSKLQSAYDYKKKYFKNSSNEHESLMYPGTTKNMMKNKFFFSNKCKDVRFGDPS